MRFLRKIPYKVLFCILMVLKLFDCITTKIGVEKFGIEGELNPVINWTIRKTNLDFTLLLSFFIVFFLGLLLKRFDKTKFYFFILIVIHIFIVINNTVWITLGSVSQ